MKLQTKRKPIKVGHESKLIFKYPILESLRQVKFNVISYKRKHLTSIWDQFTRNKRFQVRFLALRWDFSLVENHSMVCAG